MFTETIEEMNINDRNKHFKKSVFSEERDSRKVCNYDDSPFKHRSCFLQL